VRISRASLQTLAGYAEAFAPHRSIGRLHDGETDATGVIHLGWYEYEPEVERFEADMYAAKLVRPVDWMQWAGTPEAQQLIADPAAIAQASHDDLIYLLTTILRGERFSDGEIAGAYERGTLLAIAQRAQVLLDGQPGRA
jgi:Family of unknown function (DUF6508)